MDTENADLEERYLKGFHLAKVREQLGGIKATESSMFKSSVDGLISLGWHEDAVLEAIELEFTV